MTLVVYDSEGKLIGPMTGNYAVPVGDLSYLEVDVPEGKYISGVDITATPHAILLEDYPKPETLTRLELLEAVVNSLVLA